MTTIKDADMVAKADATAPPTSVVVPAKPNKLFDNVIIAGDAITDNARIEPFKATKPLTNKFIDIINPEIAVATAETLTANKAHSTMLFLVSSSIAVTKLIASLIFAIKGVIACWTKAPNVIFKLSNSPLNFFVWNSNDLVCSFNAADATPPSLFIALSDSLYLVAPSADKIKAAFAAVASGTNLRINSRLPPVALLKSVNTLAKPWVDNAVSENDFFKSRPISLAACCASGPAAAIILNKPAIAVCDSLAEIPALVNSI